MLEAFDLLLQFGACDPAGVPIGISYMRVGQRRFSRVHRNPHLSGRHPVHLRGYMNMVRQSGIQAHHSSLIIEYVSFRQLADYVVEMLRQYAVEFACFHSFLQPQKAFLLFLSDSGIRSDCHCSNHATPILLCQLRVPCIYGLFHVELSGCETLQSLLSPGRVYL